MNEAERVGWLCSYVPEEVIMAAGLLPVRVSGGGGTVGTADAYLYPNVCPFVKSVMALGLNGQTKDMSGLVFTRSCDGMRRLYDVWKAYVPTRFVYMLEVPKNRDGAAVAYFATQLRRFATVLGQEFGREITDRSLNQAIEAANQARRLMQGMYQTQRTIPLPFSGSEVFQLGLEGMGMAKDAFVKKLKEYRLPTANQTSGKGKDGKARILVMGNVVDRPDLFNLIENGGADVVAADL
ncbi:MAG: 2-hydroxyacyl-CoA dehydratase, partial [Chloroflexi bacterium]|nr:2-hydroxyacyl-CoA dehydratase [Chloroflexota bacterium]